MDEANRVLRVHFKTLMWYRNVRGKQRLFSERLPLEAMCSTSKRPPAEVLKCVLTETPERLMDSHRAFCCRTQAGESIAYGSGGELRVGRCDLGVFVTSSKVSRHLEGS